MKKFNEIKLPPQITKPIEYFYNESKDKLYLVYEYVQDGLGFWVQKTKQMSNDEKKKFVLNVAIQIIKALIWFEENNLVYCDFKMFEPLIGYKPNLFITCDKNNRPLVKIFDFGSLCEGKCDIKDKNEMWFLCNVLRDMEKVFNIEIFQEFYSKIQDAPYICFSNGDFLNLKYTTKKFESFKETLEYLNNKYKELENKNKLLS